MRKILLFLVFIAWGGLIYFAWISFVSKTIKSKPLPENPKMEEGLDQRIHDFTQDSRRAQEDLMQARLMRIKDQRAQSESLSSSLSSRQSERARDAEQQQEDLIRSRLMRIGTDQAASRMDAQDAQRRQKQQIEDNRRRQQDLMRDRLQQIKDRQR